MDNKFDNFPVHLNNLKLNLMTAKEFREAQEEIWEWIDEAEMLDDENSPHIDIIDEARRIMGEIINERVDRHSDEKGRTPE